MGRRAANLLILVGAFGYSNCNAQESSRSEALGLVLSFLFPKVLLWTKLISLASEELTSVDSIGVVSIGS